MSKQVTIFLIIILVLAMGYFFWTELEDKSQQKLNPDNSTKVEYDSIDLFSDREVEDILVISFRAKELLGKLKKELESPKVPYSFRFRKKEQFSYTLETKNTFGIYETDIYHNFYLRQIWKDINGNVKSLLEVVSLKNKLYLKENEDDSFREVVIIPESSIQPWKFIAFMESYISSEKFLEFSMEDEVYQDENGSIVFLDEIDPEKISSYTTKAVHIYKAKWEENTKNINMFIYSLPNKVNILACRMFISDIEMDDRFLIQFTLKKLQSEDEIEYPLFEKE